MGVATHSQTGELLAVYRALHSEGSLWVRPLSMFLEKVMVEGVAKPRFAFVGSDPLSLPPSARNYLKEPILAPVGDEG